MSAGKYDIILDQGSDWAAEMVIKQDGVVRDLTGYSGRAQIRKRHSDVAATAAFTVNITDAVNGTLSMQIDHTVTQNIEPGVYFYDLELYTAADASVSRILNGKVTVTPEVTK